MKRFQAFYKLKLFSQSKRRLFCGSKIELARTVVLVSPTRLRSGSLANAKASPKSLPTATFVLPRHKKEAHLRPVEWVRKIKNRLRTNVVS